jgi:xanthine dehydrogenase accessory factor
VQVRGEGLDSAVVDVELAVRIAAGREEQERTPARAVERVRVELDATTRDVGEHGQRIPELAPVDAREQFVERLHVCYPSSVDEVLAKAEAWRGEGEEVALATVVGSRRSAPRPLGSKLAVTASGRLFGSVSGGCVEADVAERAQAVLEGEPPRVVSYGIEDEEAWTVGLPCGGEIDVFIEQFGGAPTRTRGASYVVVEGTGIGERWEDDSRGAATGLREEEGRSVFVERLAPPPRLVAVGAGDIAEALCALAKPLGWRTVVADPRAGLATRDRVPSADEIQVVWPDELEIDEETALVSLVHEDRIDIPALRRGVEGGAFFVGALGSRRTQEKRREKLGDLVESIHGPVGLELGGETPAEIAFEILGQMLAVLKNAKDADVSAASAAA